MLKNDTHRRAMDRLEQLIAPDWVAESEAKHQALWDGRALDEPPCCLSTPVPADWPSYPFTERWDNVEKNFIHIMGGNYVGALLRDDRLLSIEPDYGVVTLPELFGVESEITDEGNSMSKGLNDVEKVRALVERGVPSFDNPLSRKIEEFEDFGRAVLSQYPKLRELVHWNIPNIQGPFDLACLIWGRDIYVALYDQPDLIEKLMDLVTDAFIAYGTYHKKRLGLPMDSAYHCAGVKLVHGGVRICVDSSVLVSGETYRTLSKPRDIRGFAPFSGGWIHFCGNGNHFLDALFDMEEMHYLHMGNPDSHDLLKLAQLAEEKKKVIVWSGSLEKIRDAWALAGASRILVLPENRYGARGLADARERLARVRRFQAIPKANW